MAKRKIKYHSFVEDGIRYMECSNCGSFINNIGDDAKSILCSRCFNMKYTKMFPEKEQQTKRPPGWHWMKEFVDIDGNVFHKGKEKIGRASCRERV